MKPSGPGSAYFGAELEGHPGDKLLELSATVVSAYVSRNALNAGELPKLIAQVHASLKALGGAAEVDEVPELRPAVAIKKSITPDYLICLEDGRKFKSLKRHLKIKYNMSPEEYRAKWNLRADYPMVAPSYSEVRSRLAKSIGLGRKPAAPAKSIRSRSKALA